MKIFVLFLFLVIINFSNCYYIHCLDDALNRVVSSYIYQSSLQPVEYTINKNKTIYNSTNMSMINNTIEVEFINDSRNVVMNYLTLKKENITQLLYHDLNLFTKNENNILPYNIIKGFNSTFDNNKIKQRKINCNFTFPDLIYEKSNNVLNESFYKIKTFNNLNLAINQVKDSVIVISKTNENYNLTKLAIEDFNKTLNYSFNINNIWISKASNDVINLIILSNSFDVFIYNLTLENLKVKKHSKISLDKSFNDNDSIIDISIKNDKLIIANKYKGILLFSNITGTLTTFKIDKFKNENLIILDMIVNEYTIYLIIEAKGLFIYNLNKNELNLTLNHPNLYYFDKTLNRLKENFSNYISILVDNSRSLNIAEILIELLIDADYEETPKINLIYTTRNYFNLTFIGSDNQRSYFYDSYTKYLITLIRGVQTYTSFYNYKINLVNLIDKNIKMILNLKNNQNNDLEIIFIYNENSNLMLKNFKETNSKLTCNFQDLNLYYINYYTYDKCFDNTYDSNNYICTLNSSFIIDYTKSYNNININNDLDTETKHTAYLVLALLVIIIILSIIFIIFKTKKSEYQMGIDNNENMLELSKVKRIEIASSITNNSQFKNKSSLYAQTSVYTSNIDIK